MTAKPTPGPWRAATADFSKETWLGLIDGPGPNHIVQRGQDVIAAVWSHDGGDDAANARLIARLANLYFAGIRQEERQATIERELGRCPPDLAYGLTENERAAALMMNALLTQNDALREVAKGFIREHENLEDRAPVDVHCGDCNLGTGQHRRLCPYHAAVAALKP